MFRRFESRQSSTVYNMDENKTMDDVKVDEDRESGNEKNLTTTRIEGKENKNILEVWSPDSNRCLLCSSSHTYSQRYINPQAIVNFGFTLQAAWEAAGTSFQFSLLNGGPASLVYGSVIAGIGSTAIATSLAEMASM